MQPCVSSESDRRGSPSLMTKPFRCSLTIRSDTRYLAPLRDFVRAAITSASCHMDGRVITSLCMALVEAVDNAIVHAHGRRKSMPIGVSLLIKDKEVNLEVVDMGSGISHLSFAEPSPLSCGGRGLFLIRSVMTSVASSTGKRGHRLRMVLRI